MQVFRAIFAAMIDSGHGLLDQFTRDADQPVADTFVSPELRQRFRRLAERPYRRGFALAPRVFHCQCATGRSPAGRTRRGVGIGSLHSATDNGFQSCSEWNSPSIIYSQTRASSPGGAGDRLDSEWRWRSAAMSVCFRYFGRICRARLSALNPLCAGIWSTPNVSKPSPDVLWTDTSHCHVGSQSRMRAYLAHDG